MKRVVFAEWILPITRPAIHNGALIIEDDQLRFIGPQKSYRGSQRIVEDLGHAVVFPALVNTVYHPELIVVNEEHLPKGSFLSWWRFAWQQAQTLSASELESRVLSAVKGFYDSGTAAVGLRTVHLEIAELMKPSGLFLALFYLIHGFRSSEADLIWKKTLQYSEQFSNETTLHHHFAGELLFTVSPRLFMLLSKQEWRTALPIATGPEETLFLEKRQGPLYQFLLSRDDMDYRWKPTTNSVGKYYSTAGYPVSHNILFQTIHITEEDLDWLAEREQTFYFALSPRFNRKWELGLPPARRILEKGFTLCLGTFAEHTDMRREMQSAAAEYGFSPQEVLTMATINGARALGFDKHLGSLEPGKQARLCLVKAPSSIADPYDTLIFSSEKFKHLS